MAKEGETEILEKTQSVCPECFKEGEIKVIDAEVIAENNKVYLTKKCKNHGGFREICSTNADLYKRSMKYLATGKGVSNPQIKSSNCPFDCGLCPRHKSQTVLTNIIITNRCNLRCSYCFANAGAQGFVYEPSLGLIREMLQKVRNEQPVPSKAIQNTGGEPTIRDDLIDIIKMEKEMGFTHIQLNTNAIKIAEEPELAKKYREAGVDTIYMSFDGLTKKSNPWLDMNLKAIDAFREAKLGVVLVPTVIKTYNDDQLGNIIKFATENLDVIRGVNFQPVSFVGRIENLDEKMRLKERITYAESIEKIEKQLGGAIKAEDWYPVPFVFPISKLVETLKGSPQVEFTAHPACGGATYVFIENDEIVPVTRFIDVEGLFEFIENQSKTSGAFKKIRISVSFLRNVSKFIDKEKAPKGFNLKRLLISTLLGGTYESFGKFHFKSLYLGSMWFQDAWNLNMSRLERCCIHYTTPDGIIPFCAYNGLGYNQKIEKKHSISIKEWEAKTGRTMRDDVWKLGE